MRSGLYDTSFCEALFNASALLRRLLDSRTD
jgi:hypothetical protein